MDTLQKLSVLANGTAMVTDYEALNRRIRKFIGRRFDDSLGVAGGWVPLDAPTIIPNRLEYRIALKEGDLVPADDATRDYLSKL